MQHQFSAGAPFEIGILAGVQFVFGETIERTAQAHVGKHEWRRDSATRRTIGNEIGIREQEGCALESSLA